MSTVLNAPSFQGLYDPPEAAAYLAATLRVDIPDGAARSVVHSSTVLRWMRAGLSDPALRAVPGRELLLTFEDLISMRIVSILRLLNVSWPKIHRAERWLRQHTGYLRPFALQRVWTETVDVFAEFTPGLIAASRDGQLAFVELLGEYLRPVQDMDFGDIDESLISRAPGYINKPKVAANWTPHADVLIAPEVQLGQPCLEGTRIATHTLWLMWRGGDSIARLARMYDQPEERIEHALDWEDRLSAAESNTISH